MMMLSEATNAMQGTLMGADGRFSSVDFDTRRLQQDALFFAIHGDSQNGHKFIAQATNTQAIAAVADENFASDASIRHIKVEDTTAALGMLASYWREQFDLPVVGITGSNGKTTVTQLVNAIFSEAIPGIAPQGSFNNHWGVPLTLLKLRKVHQSAVIEMGMNHAGELSYLGRIVKPTIALITNAAQAHLEGLKNVQGVANAKGEIIDSLDNDGVMILNRDDAFYSQWSKRADKRTIISFGLHAQADIQLIESDVTGVSVNISGLTHDFDFPLIGQHNRLNAAAAIAVAIAADVSLEKIKLGLKKVSAEKGRLQVYKLPQGVLIDDTYNANQASMHAAVDVLRDQIGIKVMVLGAMGEQGSQSEKTHYEVGQYAKQQGVDYLFCLNELDKPESAVDVLAYQQGFGSESKVYSDVATLVEELKKIKELSLSILVKGSRFTQMERVVDAINIKEAPTC